MHNYKEVYSNLLKNAKQANTLLETKPDEIETQELLANIKEETMIILDSIRQYLILSEDPFYGSLYNQLIQKVDFKIKTISKITVEQGYLCLVFNPLKFVNIRNKYSLTYKNLCALIVHDLLHMINKHFQIFAQCNTKSTQLKKLFDIATDAEVNDQILKEKAMFRLKNSKNCLIELHKEISITSSTIQDMCTHEGITYKVNPNKDYLYYLGVLSTFKSVKLEEKKEENNEHSDDHSFSKKYEKSDEGTNVETLNLTSQNHDDYYDDDQNIEDINSKIVSVVRQAAEDAKSRGELSEHSRTIVDSLNIVAPAFPIDIINRALGKIPYKKKRDFRKEKRGREYNIMLRGTKQDRVNDIIIARDTSGSVSEHELKCFNLYIKDILEQRKHKIRIIDCDTEITKIQDIKNLESYEINGAGGTKYSPVINYINDVYEQDDVHNRLKYQGAIQDNKTTLLIYLTDGYGEREIPICHNLFTIWVLTTKVNNFSVENPYNSDVVSLLDDPEWRLILNNKSK